MARSLFLIVLFTISSFLSLLSQTNSDEKYTISGYVKEESTGEYLIGANVYLVENKKGATTNVYGFYSITVEKGDYTLAFSFIGYRDTTMAIKLDKDLRINISMLDISTTVKEVVVNAEGSEKNIKGTQMGTFNIDIDNIKKLPAFMGEVDILKMIQLLPGVSS